MVGNSLKIKLEDLPENWEELYKQRYYPEDTLIVWGDEDSLNEDEQWFNQYFKEGKTFKINKDLNTIWRN